MTTPQTLTNDDAALGIVQLTIVHGLLGQTADADIPTEAVGRVAHTLGGALDEILTIVDGVNLPHTDLDRAVGIIRDVRRQIAQVEEHAGALTSDTVQRIAATLRERLVEAITLSQPFALGGNPERSSLRRDALTGGNPIPAPEPQQQTPDSLLPWLTGQTEETEQDTVDEPTPSPRADSVAELIERAQRAARGAPSVPQSRREMQPPRVQDPPRPQAEPTQAFSEGQTVYVLDGGVPRQGRVQILGGTTFVIVD